MVLNPTDYLTSQGWSGPGTGFTATARSKPVTVLQKRNNSGIGKDRDTGYAWWDDVFSRVASKVGKPPEGNQLELTPRTITGLISHLPPPISEPSSSSHAQPLCSNLNLDAIDYAKQNAARRDLYRRFLRGSSHPGTAEKDRSTVPIPISPKMHPQIDGGFIEPIKSHPCKSSEEKPSKKRKRKQSKAKDSECKAEDRLVNVAHDNESKARGSICSVNQPLQPHKSVDEGIKTPNSEHDSTGPPLKHKKKRGKKPKIPDPLHTTT